MENIHKERKSRSNRPLLSVCIPTYNGERFLAKAICSVLNQTFVDFELILVDDCSSDSTKTIIQSFDDKRIKFFQNSMRLGLVGNWNECIKLSNGDYICIFHHDDIMLPQNLERKMGTLLTNPNVGLVYSDVIIVDEKENVLHEGWYFTTETNGDFTEAGAGFFDRLLLGSNLICCPSVVTSKECYEKLGYFDSNLPFTADWEMWLRITQNFDIAFLSQPLIQYREHDNNETNNFTDSIQELEQYHHAKMIALDRCALSVQQIKKKKHAVNEYQVKLALQQVFNSYRRKQYDTAQQFLTYAIDCAVLEEEKLNKSSIDWFLTIFDEINSLVKVSVTDLEQRCASYHLANELQMKEIGRKDAHVKQQEEEIGQQNKKIDQQEKKFARQGVQIKQQAQEINRRDGLLEQQQNQIDQDQTTLQQQHIQIDALQTSLEDVYKTRVWRIAVKYWHFKGALFSFVRKLYRMLVPNTVRILFWNWRHPQETAPGGLNEMQQVISDDQVRSIPIGDIEILSDEQNVAHKMIIDGLIRNFPPEKTKALPKKQNKIAFVLPCGVTLGGVTTWSIEMSSRLVKSNVPTTIVKHPEFGVPLEIEMPSRVPLIESACHPSPVAEQLLQAVPDYYAVLPAVIVPNYDIAPYALCASLSIHKSKHLRVIGYCHTDDTYYYALLSYYEPIIHLFVAVSQESADSLVKIIPHRQKDIIVRPYGTSVPKSLRRNYSSIDKPLELIYAGRMEERQKRVSDLPKLAQALATEGVNFHLRIVGSGPDREMLSDSIQALDESIRQRITMTEPVSLEQMPNLWRSSDICVLVSEFEGTSISMLEAMAWGCVPVVTRVSGTKAVVDYGHNGFLSPIGDVEAMARIIKLIDSDRECLTEIGQNAHNLVSKNYSYDEYVNFFKDRVDEAWQQRPRVWPVEKELLINQKQLVELEAKIRTQLSD